VVTIAAGITSRLLATATASNLHMVLRIQHPTPAPLPSPAIPSRRSSHGTPSMDNNTLPKVHHTLRCRPRTTTPTTLRRFTSSNRHTAASPNTKPLLSRLTASPILLRRRTAAFLLSSGALPLNHRPTEHMVVDAVDAAVTMIEAVQRDS
jgi:hypothetical protein